MHGQQEGVGHILKLFVACLGLRPLRCQVQIVDRAVNIVNVALGQYGPALLHPLGDLGLIPSLLTRLAQFGSPHSEADLLSYLLFDGCFTGRAMELGREDARARSDEIHELLLEG